MVVQGFYMGDGITYFYLFGHFDPNQTYISGRHSLLQSGSFPEPYFINEVLLLVLTNLIRLLYFSIKYPEYYLNSLKGLYTNQNHRL